MWGNPLGVPENLLAIQVHTGLLTSPLCQALCWGMLGAQPGPYPWGAVMGQGEMETDNPEEQGSDAAWAVALQGREHSPAQGPRGDVELGGKRGEEDSRQREQHPERHGVEKSRWAQGGQFTPFNVSRAQSTEKHSGRKQAGEERFLGTLKAKPRILGCTLRAVRRHWKH